MFFLNVFWIIESNNISNVKIAYQYYRLCKHNSFNKGFLVNLICTNNEQLIRCVFVKSLICT